jgi:O-acetyl-ADP-ribose deacetylase (regulator of RNase III)
LAEKHQLESIAFPAISTGIFGYPLAEAAKVAMNTVAAEAARLKHVRRVRFVLRGREAMEAHAAALKSVEARDPP